MNATLTESAAKKRLAFLSQEIKAADGFYYQDDNPVMTDAAYDALRQELNTIEAAFPHLCCHLITLLPMTMCLNLSRG